MALDVEVPDPPSLPGPQPRGEYDAVDEPEEEEQGDDYRREEVAGALAEGAWADAFDEWAATAGVSEREFEAVRALGLLDRFDFYWVPSAEDVGYRAPAVSASDRAALADAGGDPDEVEGELDALGRTVSEVLENDYLVRDAEAEFGFFAEESEEPEEPEERKEFEESWDTAEDEQRES